jgi:hypothetical protein
MSEPFMVLYTIYDHPKDHPAHFVVRGHEILRSGGSRPLLSYALASTLEDARHEIPPGHYNIGREPGDDACIVETWI